jgi:hypothetical protein
MKKSPELDPLASRPNLDFRQGVQGKYAKRMEEGSNLVLIEPDLLDTFPDSASVSEAVRSLKKTATRAAKPTPRSLSR